MGRETDAGSRGGGCTSRWWGAPVYFTSVNKWRLHQRHGTTAPAPEWSFAEGTTREGFEEWLCLANPGDTPASVSVNLALEDGSSREMTVTIPPRQRRTVDVNALVGPERDVSACVTADADILAERAMYFEYRGRWQGGHALFGQPSATGTSSRYFAEGYTGAGFETWLCLFYPVLNDGPSGASAATVPLTLTFMFDDGSTRSEPMSIRSTSG